MIFNFTVFLGLLLAGPCGVSDVSAAVPPASSAQAEKTMRLVAPPPSSADRSVSSPGGLEPAIPEDERADLAGAGPAGGRLPLPDDAASIARRTVHLLEYIAVDYGGAVSNGQVVRPTEYDEQLSFIGEIDTRLTDLGIGANGVLRESLDGLRAVVQSRAAPARVTERARSLAEELRLRFNVQELPPRTPSVENGRRLYSQACASCHGGTGRGDGPLSADLDPRPASFLNRDRMLALPLSAVFATITYGIDGTAMASFEDAFDTAQRYDLAFFVGSMAFAPDEIARGAALAANDSSTLGAHVAGLAQLIAEPAGELGRGSDDSVALVAYARTHPEIFEASPVSLSIARDRLDASWRAYVAGDADKAAELAVSAYLDGFEPVEPRLDALRGDLRTSIEVDFLRYRQLLRGGVAKEVVEAQREQLLGSIDEARAALEGAEFGPAAAFFAAFTILAREGFEAVLIVLAISGLLARAGRRDALRYVNAGWIVALAAGIGTWLLARRLIDISGASREVIEGASSLLAAGILFYVSYWLIAKISSQRWQTFLRTRVHTALHGGSLWTLATIAFVAVYREVFETILFFEAITAQAGPRGLHAVLFGTGAGALVLTGLAVGMSRFGSRMPVRRFFLASSALLYLLAVVLAGQGVAALQEAGMVRATHVPFVRIDWLGVHPTAESLGLQGALVSAAIVAAAWTLMHRSRDPAVVSDKAAA